MKEFADDNFKFDENGRKLSKWVENTVGKGEIARYEQFLLFPQCFQKACFPGESKGVIVWEWVNYLPNCKNLSCLKLKLNEKLKGMLRRLENNMVKGENDPASSTHTRFVIFTTFYFRSSGLVSKNGSQWVETCIRQIDTPYHV